MAEARKNAQAREKDLRLAIHRIERGRTRTNSAKLSIASVAREAGVSPALIHNHYPVIADIIRVAQGRDSRTRRDQKHVELKAARGKLAEQREEIRSLQADIARLASINEVLIAENAILKAKISNAKVVELKRKNHGGGLA